MQSLLLVMIRQEIADENTNRNFQFLKGEEDLMRFCRVYLRRTMIVFGGILATIAFIIWAHLSFHAIEPGVVYGSPQLTAAGFEQRISEYNIRSILNLRGPNPDLVWYQQEKAAAARKGVTHIDIPGTSSKFFPFAHDMRNMVHKLETCPKPTLVHCHSGIDRTGLVHIIWLLLSDETESPETVLENLSLWRLHCSLRASYQMKLDFLRRYRVWLQKVGLKHTPTNFRQWIYNGYHHDAPEERDV